MGENETIWLVTALNSLYKEKIASTSGYFNSNKIEEGKKPGKVDYS